MSSLYQLLATVLGSDWDGFYAVFLCKQGHPKTTLLVADVVRAMMLSPDKVQYVKDLLKELNMFDFVTYRLVDGGMASVTVWKRMALVLLGKELSCKPQHVPAKTAELLRKSKMTRSKYDYSVHSNCIRIIRMRLEREFPYCYHCNERNTKVRLCSGCKSVKYCGKECQTANWEKHRADCASFASEANVARTSEFSIDSILSMEFADAIKCVSRNVFPALQQALNVNIDELVERNKNTL